MSDDDPRLAELDLEVVSITRDANGEVSVDGGGMALEGLVFLLQSAIHITMHEWFYPEDDDED